MRLLTIAVLALLPSGAALAQTEAAAPSPAPVRTWELPVEREPSLVVFGEAAISRPPDEAEIVLGAEAQATTAAAAQAQVNGIMSRTVDALREQGIAQRNMRTTGLTIQPVYDMSGTNRGGTKLEGYRASNTVRLTIAPGRVASAVDAATGAGANRIEGITFRLADDAAAKRAVLREAFAEARAKAEGLAAEGGFRVGEVQEVTETVSAAPQRGATWWELGSLEAGRAVVEPGEHELRGGVSVRFAIESVDDEPVRTRGEEAPRVE